jgi:hypothetical protein
MFINHASRSMSMTWEDMVPEEGGQEEDKRTRAGERGES